MKSNHKELILNINCDMSPVANVHVPRMELAVPVFRVSCL